MCDISSSGVIEVITKAISRGKKERLAVQFEPMFLSPVGGTFITGGHTLKKS